MLDIVNMDIVNMDINSEKMINEFKKCELEEIMIEQRKIMECISLIELEKDRICENLPKYDPKAIHLANQHLAVIQSNLHEQLCELKKLIIHLEKSEIIILEEKNSYLKMQAENEHFNRVFRLFVPYILICSIYLKMNDQKKSSN